MKAIPVLLITFILLGCVVPEPDQNNTAEETVRNQSVRNVSEQSPVNATLKTPEHNQTQNQTNESREFILNAPFIPHMFELDTEPKNISTINVNRTEIPDSDSMALEFNQLVSQNLSLINQTVQKVIFDPAIYGQDYTPELGLFEIVKIYNWIAATVLYVSDIDQYGQNEYWASAAETLENRKGDCEDYAVLYAAMIRSIGGTVKLADAGNHLFALVYMGNRSEEPYIRNYLDSVYSEMQWMYECRDSSGSVVPCMEGFYYLADEDGLWLIAETTGGMWNYLGSLPPEAVVYSQENGTWGYPEPRSLKLIRIY